MLDIFTWAAVFLLGCLIALIVGAIFIAAIFYLQNGGRDD
jgi:hypothetical protein